MGVSPVIWMKAFISEQLEQRGFFLQFVKSDFKLCFTKCGNGRALNQVEILATKMFTRVKIMSIMNGYFEKIHCLKLVPTEGKGNRKIYLSNFTVFQQYSQNQKLDKMLHPQYKSIQLVRGVTSSTDDQSKRKAQTTLLTSADHTDHFVRSTECLIQFNKENMWLQWKSKLVVFWARPQQWKSVQFNQLA